MDPETINENRKWAALLAEEGDRPLTWNDLGASDIQRFKMEEAGRSYAANPSADILLEPLRRVFDDYMAKAEAEAVAAGEFWMGAALWSGVPSDPMWPSSVRLSDLKAAVKEEENYRKAEREVWEQRKGAAQAKSAMAFTGPIVRGNSTSQDRFAIVFASLTPPKK